jgi:hypothetical protein
MPRTEGQRALACRRRHRDRDGSGNEPLISRPAELFVNAAWEDTVVVCDIPTIPALPLLLGEGGGIAALQSIDSYIGTFVMKQAQLQLGWIEWRQRFQ